MTTITEKTGRWPRFRALALPVLPFSLLIGGALLWIAAVIRPFIRRNTR